VHEPYLEVACAPRTEDRMKRNDAVM